ncbi:MAG: 3-deoxy-manno-octulosonate cytidylyltransferase [Armatimonadota bacterium]|nr:3-deoxy-manno-octulosonate cytidylyltransferase [Armatimonadota bacterium]
MSAASVIGMIPARYKSTRLPGKVLLDLAGKPMIQRVYERCCGAELLDEVLVATDDERVRQAVEAFGGRVEMTSPEHRSGTDRLAEVAGRRDCDVICNVQGDEPMIAPEAIDAAVQPFLDDPQLQMGTIATPIETLQEHLDPATVKVVTDADGWALYFSRSPIPHFRLEPGAQQPDAPRRHPDSGLMPLKHIGLYVYRREMLLWYSRQRPSLLERTEKLEQLRVLEAGRRIRVVQVDYSPIGVDTPEDLARVRELLAREETHA